MTAELRQLELIFDSREGERRKREGMELAADARRELVEEVRDAMRALARRRGTVTADDAQYWLMRNGHAEGVLGNAMGTLFLAREWECCDLTKSVRAKAHGNLLRVWRLRCGG